MRDIKIRTDVKIIGEEEKKLVEKLSHQFSKEVKIFENGDWELAEIKTANANYGKLKKYYFKFPNSKNREYKRQGIHSFIKSVAIRSGVFLIADGDIKNEPYYDSPEMMDAYYKKNAPPKCSEVLVIVNFNTMIEKLANILTKDLPVKVINNAPKKQLIFNIKNAKEEEKKHVRFCLNKARPEQQKFRKMLLKEYKSTCMITKCKIEAVLEAAHIKPFADNKDDADDTLENGLLLRADLHLLFDKEFMGIHPNSGKLHFKCTDGYYDEYTHAKIPEDTILRKNLKTRWKSFNENKGAKK